MVAEWNGHTIAAAWDGKANTNFQSVDQRSVLALICTFQLSRFGFKPREGSMTISYIYFDLYRCQSWRHPDDLLTALNGIINVAHLIPLENQRVNVGHKQWARPVAKDVPGWFQSNYRYRDNWDSKTFSGFRPKEIFNVYFRTPLQEEWLMDIPIINSIDIQLDAMSFGEAYNSISFSCGLYSKSAISMGVSTLERLPEVVNLYRSFAETAIALLRPEYAYITDRYYKELYGNDIIKNKLKYIYWWNYYGSTYLRKYGKSKFTQAPGWRTGEYADGLSYQITQRFEESKDEQTRTKILEYFRDLKIKDVA
jgi:hypothetical protein